MTLTIAPETEMRLKAVAEGQGRDLVETHAEILARGLEEAEARLQEEAAELEDTLVGLGRSMADIAAGRWMDAAEFDRRMAAKASAVQARRNAPAAQ